MVRPEELVSEKDTAEAETQSRQPESGAAARDRDEALFCRYLAGDESSLRALMERYGDRLTLYLGSFCGGLDEAEELMVEAFARVCLQRPALRYNSFRAYLFKTARRLAMRANHRKLPAYSLDEMELDPQSSESLENSFLRDEMRRTLRRCMARLEPDVREALWLVYFENLRYAEAAQVLGKKEKQLDYLLQKGKRLLREELKGEEITDARY